MNGPRPIPEDIGDRLVYDPEDGTIRWKTAKSSRTIVGSIAGHRRRDGYLSINIDNKAYLAHRVAFFLMTGRQPAIVDHRDTDRANDRWSNLREADPSESQANRRGVGKRYPKGVNPAHGAKGFTASIKFRGKRRHLGTFPNASEAHAAYCAAAIEVHGDYARTA